MAEKVDRMTRVNELLKRELANIFSREGFFPDGMLISVTEVNTSTDLRNATVMLSFFGGKRSTIEAAMHEIELRRVDWQKKIANVMKFKHTPVLYFKIDRRIAAGDRVLQILESDELKNAGGDD